MDKIKHYIEANIEGCGCNLECSYCYLRQAGYNQARKESCLGYSLDEIRKACSKERLGGACLFNLVGDGETLLPREIIDLVEVLVMEGHYVNVLTNGTITERIRELVERLEKAGKKSHVCLHVSLHYMELKKKGLLDIFFKNIHYIQEQGMSFHIKSVLGSEFDEALADELKKLCETEVGAYPQVGIARQDNPDGTFGICTELAIEEYFAMGDGFASSMFELDKREFNRKRKEFCYAGEWCFMLNFSTGKCWQCLSNRSNTFDFFENMNELPLAAVGYRCNRDYCSCTNFQAWGVMPEHEEVTNLEVFDRPEANWIKEPFKTILSQKLYETNEIYSESKKKEISEKAIEKEILNRQYVLAMKMIEEQNWETAASVIQEMISLDLFTLEEVWMQEIILIYGHVLLNSTGYENEYLVYEDFFNQMKDNAEYMKILNLLYAKAGVSER